jgi:hypothetical protein
MLCFERSEDVTGNEMKQERCGDKDKEESLEDGDAGNGGSILDEQLQGRIGQKYPEQAEDRIDPYNL